ncbi:dipeptide ABC transporter ATP-binding protein [Ruegeria sp. 2205SS24-7]|uniref:ABC transporter ATP-binding protein n=1 Tax=Ruegeria discodermiae TaxID=3064389 RepID=UPI0027423B65|nr:dipeptide ABC transporter ATP-binding protein [Ruegeria sp. 2205SS24-7]MDP5220390.1 dipeptide ABC transporter ATP-binding protein [Ruegeria sp. 2205SS24-7]
MKPLLEVKDLSVTLKLAEGDLTAVSGISLSVAKGETLGIVGESGSGKSISSLAVMDLLPKGTIRKATTMRFGETDLLSATPSQMASLRGNKIAMIFQEPMTSLNPVYTIGRQMTELMTLHKGVSKKVATDRAVELLEKVGITAARSRLSQYPHQLSGGLRQRVMIAMMLMCEPELIIADEPTTALDVTIQAQILNLLRELQQEMNMAMIIITHDLGVVARVSDKVSVMYAGQIVETGSVEEVFRHPVHPYTQGLLESIPVSGEINPGEELGSIPGLVPSLKTNFKGCRFANRCSKVIEICHNTLVDLNEISSGRLTRCLLSEAEARAKLKEEPKVLSDHVYGSRVDMTSAPVMSADNAQCVFQIKPNMFAPKKPLRAVDNISIDLRKGEVVAVVGESGCGKSTLARMLLGLQSPTSGTISLDGEDVSEMSNVEKSKRVQSIFQDPYSSLNPRRTIGEIIRRPLQLHGSGTTEEQKEQVEAIMERVGIPRRLYHNYPNQLSGGQRQRVAIARALVLKPEIVICDEPTSALDVSVQAQILNLLLELRSELRLTYLLITHDMAVVEHIATRVVVMYLGRVVEIADARDIFQNPQHPYTKALLSSVLTPEPDADVPDTQLGTSYPNPIDPPSGCTFHPRCPLATQVCKERAPVLSKFNPTTEVACHLVEAAPMAAE